MSKQRRSQRGLTYEDARRDQASRFRIIVDELLDSGQPPTLKLRNGGGHHYQRRHLDLIAYRVQGFHGDPMAWNHNVRYYHETDGTTHVYFNGNYVGTDRTGTETFALPISDIHFGDQDGIRRQREQLSSAILSMKHHPTPTPKADIKWPGSDADVFMEAIGHYTRARLQYPQLTLADLANPEKRIEGRMVEVGTGEMQQYALRSRMSGKSLSVSESFLHAHNYTRWFSDELRFKLLPHQRDVVDFLGMKKSDLRSLI